MSKEKTEEKITEYIEYLKKEHKLAVSVHLQDSCISVFITAQKLWRYNIHVNPYRAYVKSSARQRCIKCQQLALKKCQKQESYIGVCHAGVGEYVHAVFDGSRAVGFISVSGYRDKKIPFGKDKRYDENMKDEEIPVKLLDTLISPLAMMIERLIAEIGSNTANDTYSRILGYLNEHHAEVSADELAEKFYVSKSYISHMFKKRSGYTLNYYCNMLKVKDAKELLKGTDMSVTEVAFAVGFNNFSYFINTFKKITGVTPLAWRKKYRNEK